MNTTPDPCVIEKQSQVRAIPAAVQELCDVSEQRRHHAYRCHACGLQFQRACEISRHYSTSKCKPSVRYDVQPKKRRLAYTLRQKRDVLLDIDALYATGLHDAPKLVSEAEGIPTTTVQGWIGDRARIFLLASKGGMLKRKSTRHAAPMLPKEEERLYAEFIFRREYLKLTTTHEWLCKRMRKICAQSGVDAETMGFKASLGWSQRFCARWDITNQCRTNNHKLTIYERLPKIKDFHRWLIYGLQSSGRQRCQKYGRFPPSHMFHMDQVPLAFSSGRRRTLNRRGKRCQISAPRGSDEKRFCTLQVTICADPDAQIANLELIFRGQGKRLSKEELDFYSSLPNVNVRFQKNAWADEPIIIDYLTAFREKTAHLGEILLGMDNHGSQVTFLSRAVMEYFGIVPAFTPANCTDCVSPVDHHVGQTLKLKISSKFEEAYEADFDHWNKEAKYGGLTDSERRMLVAGWAAEAWSELCSEHKTLLKSAFVETGFLVAKDGSENHLIKLWKGGKGMYTF